MPLYEHMIMALPKYPPDKLVTVFRKYAQTILTNGGNLRVIENHGIRPIPERTTRKYASTDGQRHFWEARFISATFDASPKCLSEAERQLKGEEGILRFHTTRVTSAVERVNSRNFKNPYLQFKDYEARDH